MSETRIYACGVIKNSEGKYLLLKRSEDAKFAPGEWELVSGSLGETETAEGCIKREVSEETGLHVELVEKLEVFEIKDKDGFWVVIPFKVDVLLDEIVISEEHTEFGWFDSSEAKSLPYMQDVNRLFG